MLYRIEIWDKGKPTKIGGWVWTNKNKAIRHARKFVETLPSTVKVRQQQRRKVVYRRLPILKWTPQGYRRIEK